MELPPTINKIEVILLICKIIFTKVFQLSVNCHARNIFFGAHIQSLIECGSTLWASASKNSLKPLHSLVKLILPKQSSLEQDD